MSFEDWTVAQPFLENQTGCYCHFCEMRIDNLPAIEHIKPKTHFPRLKANWQNFLLACSYCNSNKGTKVVMVKDLYWPHKNNTAMLFDYTMGNITVRNTSSILERKARALRDLYGIDHMKNTRDHWDRRYIKRLEAVSKAFEIMPKYLQQVKTPQDVADAAADTGFWSTWYTVFKDHPAVLDALRTSPRFPGIPQHCFDPTTGEPIPRNATDI